MTRGTFRVFDHTSDIGMEVSAGTREALFETAALGLFDILCRVERVEPRIEYVFSVSAGDAEELLVAWLGELLSHHDAEGMLFSTFSVRFDGPHTLSATASGESYDPTRHEIKTELKAVTYHQVSLHQSREGWCARVVIDV